MAEFNVTRVTVAVIAGLCAAVFAAGTRAQAQLQPKRPNIVIILGDDLGFADMGSFGGEINTPNLDSLAREGVRFANFYTHASCSPTRCVMLSGVDQRAPRTQAYMQESFRLACTAGSLSHVATGWV